MSGHKKTPWRTTTKKSKHIGRTHTLAVTSEGFFICILISLFCPSFISVTNYILGFPHDLHHEPYPNVAGHPNCENCVPANFMRISCPFIFLPATLYFVGSHPAFHHLIYDTTQSTLALWNLLLPDSTPSLSLSIQH